MVEWAFRPASLTGEAVAILATADPAAKASASRRLAEIWDAGGLDVGYSLPPPRPARPERPLLRPPKQDAKAANSPDSKFLAPPVSTFVAGVIPGQPPRDA